jgi:membrane protease YdiL (CAAX protease family)
MAILSIAFNSVRSWASHEVLKDPSKLGESVKVGAVAGVAITLSTSCFLQISNCFSGSFYFFGSEDRRNITSGVGVLISTLIIPLLQEIACRVLVQEGIKKCLPKSFLEKKVNLVAGYQIQMGSLASIAASAISYAGISCFITRSAFGYVKTTAKIAPIFACLLQGAILGCLKEKLGLTASLTAHVAYQSFILTSICRILWKFNDSFVQINNVHFWLIQPHVLSYAAGIAAPLISEKTWKSFLITALPLEDYNKEETSKEKAANFTRETIKTIAIGVGIGIISILKDVGLDLLQSLMVRMDLFPHITCDYNFYNSPISLYDHFNKGWDLDLTEVYEETIFRAILQESIKILASYIPLGRDYNNLISIMISSYIFGFFHQGSGNTLGSFYDGIVYGFLKEHFGVLSSISAHLTHNHLIHLLDYLLKNRAKEYMLQEAKRSLDNASVYGVTNDRYALLASFFLPSLLNFFPVRFPIVKVVKS